MDESDRIKLNNILNNVFLSDWGKSYLTEKVANYFFIPSTVSTRTTPFLTKTLEEDWLSMVKKGVMLYGTLSIFYFVLLH